MNVNAPRLTPSVTDPHRIVFALSSSLPVPDYPIQEPFPGSFLMAALPRQVTLLSDVPIFGLLLASRPLLKQLPLPANPSCHQPPASHLLLGDTFNTVT